MSGGFGLGQAPDLAQVAQPRNCRGLVNLGYLGDRSNGQRTFERRLFEEQVNTGLEHPAGGQPAEGTVVRCSDGHGRRIEKLDRIVTASDTERTLVAACGRFAQSESQVPLAAARVAVLSLPGLLREPGRTVETETDDLLRGEPVGEEPVGHTHVPRAAIRTGPVLEESFRAWGQLINESIDVQEVVILDSRKQFLALVGVDRCGSCNAVPVQDTGEAHRTAVAYRLSTADAS